ncbi:alpha/beta fold hydrolase [Bradyrhizobium sp. CCGB20]|uniref:alpha/beta fold hydrolase n=1 Tax=Bradyrhizobium sp. CCGB20 TaxID=2949633 RepID=UPI0020B32536|nr:alpha/beta fold hydrolase [Bradyrhizobium sp. CCGB20]MCP3396734.1 lipase family protein [Bradyrhizobium sp. CCGB20]
MRRIGLQMRRIFRRATMTALVTFAVGMTAAHAQSPFYDAPASLADGPPGSLVRQEPMDGAPLGASSYRVLYRSTGLKGDSILVSGVVIVPQGPPPPGGRPIVAWAHPTSGIVPRCAPSLAIFLFQQIQGLRSMVARGYIVAATDYPGLGTPGPHPYLVGESEGRAVLDIVRVARDLPGAGGARDFALWGHSQGGQAVLFAGQLAPSYAPDLHLLGVAAAAPATDLATLMSDDINSVGGKNITAMTLWSWHRVYGVALDGVLDPRALPVIDRLARECIEGPFDIFVRQRTERPLQQYFLTVPDPTKREPWRSLLEKNSAGTLPAGVPVFLAQGTVDQIIRPAVTRAYMGRLCKAGSRVRMVTLPNIGHGRAAQASTMAAVNWMTDRFAGKAAPNDCGG